VGLVTDAGAATVVHHSEAYYAAQARARQRARRALSLVCDLSGEIHT